ncbi:MAG: helix-turn-helix transcriptional regulator [Planctomycetaceae bacterium]
MRTITAVMNPKIEDRDRQFVRTLQGLGPVSVNELCEELGVTATSVRQRLNRLQAGGLVEREKISHGRGRPVHRYRVTDSGLQALGSNYGDLAVLLWSELTSIEHEPTREQVFSNLRRKMVDRFGGAGGDGSLTSRVQRLADSLGSAGVEVGVTVDADGGLPVLKGCSCPYPSISTKDDSICQLETEVFSAVLGADVELKTRCVDGHSCCEFAVSEKE